MHNNLSPVCRFKINDEAALSVHIKCTIVKRTLQILNAQGIEVKQLSFENVYYGSIVSKKLVLYNNSPIATDFVISIDEKLSECVNMSKGLAMAVTKFESRKNILEPEQSVLSTFNVSPEKV